MHVTRFLDTYLGDKDSCGQFCNSGDPTRYVEMKIGQDGRTLEATFNITLPKMWKRT